MEVEYMQEEENSQVSKGKTEATTIKEEEKVNIILKRILYLSVI